MTPTLMGPACARRIAGNPATAVPAPTDARNRRREVPRFCCSIITASQLCFPERIEDFGAGRRPDAGMAEDRAERRPDRPDAMRLSGDPGIERERHNPPARLRRLGIEQAELVGDLLGELVGGLMPLVQAPEVAQLR